MRVNKERLKAAMEAADRAEASGATPDGTQDSVWEKQGGWDSVLYKTESHKEVKVIHGPCALSVGQMCAKQRDMVFGYISC